MRLTRLPLNEFDEDDAIVRPSPVRVNGRFPPFAVLCFFPEAIDEMQRDGELKRIGEFSAQLGGMAIYATPDQHVAVFHPGVGGPLSAHCFERAIASGVRAAIAVGGAGAIAPSFGKDDVLVVSAAVRDEGTSFHYVPASRLLEFDDGEVRRLVDGCVEAGLPAAAGVTWTTDADFRETRGRTARRREEGCVAVEMEAASLAAVARFRAVRYGHVLYSGDDLTGDVWAERAWTGSGRRAALLRTAIELSVR
ncbi:nucleoside phosphorylase [Curtobacterium sp. NPDC089991]|uniref:nucleoside phosphorylase n=1 Tax=Curtobacterium sp. NPDC089991 TaxID=3363969 RepID=UPI00380F29E8